MPLEIAARTQLAVASGRRLRLSPLLSGKDMQDEDPESTYEQIVTALNGKGLGYLHITRQTETAEDGTEVVTARSERISTMIRRAWDGALLVCGGFSPGEAAAWVESGRTDFAVFGRAFIANPDLDVRIRDGLALAVPDASTYYGGGAAGYTDYPTAR